MSLMRLILVKRLYDITIIVKALMVRRSLKVTEILQKEGISAEVIDLRTLVPLDEETIVKSAKKTGRVLIVDEDYMSYGMSGEIAFRIQSKALKELKVPISRLAVPDVPIPFSEPLENAVIPSVNSIYNEAKKLVSS